MEKIRIKPHKYKFEQIAFVAAGLKKGKVIAYPTDTIYGLGCDATNKRSIARLYKIKKRPKSKPMLVLISSFKMLKKYFSVNKDQMEFLEQIWPGPYTAILQSKKKLSNNLHSKDGSAGVRLPKNTFLIELINELNQPIISTSLNIGGEKNIDKINNIEKNFKNTSRPDIAIDAGILPIKKPSTIIDLRDVFDIKILRK
jgi:L-threonylcarbamoyladenylate synthase